MSISLKLMLDFASSETVPDKVLKKYIIDALNDSEELRGIVSNVRLGPSKSNISLHEIRKAAGRARQAALSPTKRKALAKRAAKARWDK